MFNKPTLDVTSNYPQQFGRLVDIVEGPSRRNFIRNGDFMIVQRGTSFAGITTAVYTLDGWVNGAAGTSTVTQQAFTVGQTDVPNNPRFFMRVQRTVAAGSDNVVTEQRIEYPDLLAGKTVTVSFYAKVGSGTKALVFDLASSGVTSAVDTSDNAMSVTTSWQLVSATIAIPTMTAVTASAYLNLRIREAASFGTFTLDIAEVQFEEGSEATRFERLSYQDQTAWAQRFLPVFPVGGIAPAGKNIGLGQNQSTTTANVVIPFQVPTRVATTGITVSAASHFTCTTSGGGNTAATGATWSGSEINCGTINLTGMAGLVAGDATQCLLNNASGRLTFTGAEL